MLKQEVIIMARNGANWYKIDFHTHTPESKCFSDEERKDITPLKWLKAAKDAGLDAVVITDHNSVGYISEIHKIQNSNEKVNITVFYGIELCVSVNFTHIIVIFDDALGIKKIEDAVISLGLNRNDWANTEKYVTEDKLKELCDKFQGQVFVIPAHFASDKGLGQCNGNAIKQINNLINFHAIEVRNKNDEIEYAKQVNSKNLAPKLALITGSDNPSNKGNGRHSVEGFGKAFTWVKMSTLTFEGLRQAFIDHEQRCINVLQLKEMGEEYNPNAVTHNYIEQVSLSGFSHVDNLSLHFSPYLNCIVGGRGTGKSTLIESIRCSLDSSRTLSECQLINATFQDDGKIETSFRFGSTDKYQITCTRNRQNLITKTTQY